MRVETLLTAVVLWSSFAWAQEGGVDPPSAPTASGEDRVGRFGITTQLGGVAPRGAASVGLELHAGLELSQHLALLVQLSGLAGWDGTFSVACDACGNTGPRSTSSVFLLGAGALLEYSFAKKLGFIAAGPLVTYASWSGSVGRHAEVVSGPLGGVDVKGGLTIGPYDAHTDRRPGFTVGLEALAMFGSGHVYTPGLMGRDGSFTGYGLAWALVPALFFGFDWR